jgi:hypothetical protein
MVTDEIQELLEGTMRDDRMAELLHTLSVSPEKRRAFREYLTLNREIEEDRSASALTLGEDAALWESIAAAGAVGTTVATTAGRSIGIWIGRAAALLAVGVAGYLLGSQTTGTTTIVRQETGAPVAARSTRSDLTQPGAAGSTSGAHAAPSSRTVAPITANVPPAGSTSVTSQRPTSHNLASHSATPRSTSMLAAGSTRHAAGSSGSSTNGPAGPSDGRIESAQQMFDALGSGSSWSPERWAAPTIVEQKPVDAADGKQTSPAAAAIDTSKSAPAAALMRKMPEDIPFEGVEPEAPTSTLFRNGFEASFSEHNGFLPQTPSGTENPDRSFAYRTLDLSYRLNGGMIGFGARIGYGTFSHVTLEAKPVTVSDFNGLPADAQIFVGRVTATEQVITEAFVNYRHPLFERFALELEASIGRSKSHQQGAVDMSLVGFLTESIGLQLGGGAGTYWYNSDAMQAEALSSVQSGNAAIDANVRPKYQGIMLLAHYGIFYRF